MRMFRLVLMSMICMSALVVRTGWASDRSQLTMSVQILPKQVTLNGAQASQRLLVEAEQSGQYAGDLTNKAVFLSSNPGIAHVALDGTLQALRDGTATITARVNGLTTTIEARVTGTKSPFAWNFRNHFLPILT
jgi:hypothetical protein